MRTLPAFLVLPDIAIRRGIGQLVERLSCRRTTQGTVWRPAGSPILDMGAARRRHAGDGARQSGHTSRRLNKMHQPEPSEFKDLAARIESYELAFRMQAEMPPAVNIEKEPEETRQALRDRPDGNRLAGRRCLMARRLVEKGVRFVAGLRPGMGLRTITSRKRNCNRMRAVDKPIAGLLQGSEADRPAGTVRWLIWAGEFGRSRR